MENFVSTKQMNQFQCVSKTFSGQGHSSQRKRSCWVVNYYIPGKRNYFDARVFKHLPLMRYPVADRIMQWPGSGRGHVNIWVPCLAHVPKKVIFACPLLSFFFLYSFSFLGLVSLAPSIVSV